MASVFQIRFDRSRQHFGNTGSAIGTISFGDCAEGFESPLQYWGTSDYESQWKEGVGRIARGQESSCLIVSLTDPATANFIEWWLLYRISDNVVFRNAMLFLDGKGFDFRNPYARIVNRIYDENVSEWTLPFGSVAAFAK